MRTEDQLARDHTPSVLMAEADAGDGEAAHHLALMHGAGLGCPQDWSEALRRLRQAAASGHTLAKATCDFLGAEPDVQAWISPPAPTELSASPHVLTIDGFIDEATCAWIRDRAEPYLEKAKVFDPETGEGQVKWSRTNSAASFALLDCDLVMLLVRQRIARATGLPVAGLEPFHVLHYAPGEAFTPHYDWLDPSKAGHQADLEEFGQRVATFLVYLNEDFEGGETQMEAAGVRHRGKTGDALFWANVRPDGRIDLATMHAGLPPTSGEKWVYSQWLRNRAPRHLGG